MINRPPHKLYVVIDTNVWISGLIFGGTPKGVIDLFTEGDIQVITSEELLSELRRKIIQRFPLFAPQLPLLEVSIGERAMIVPLGTRPITASRDPDDNTCIETALIGGCNYIVTGDKDLLVLKKYEDVKITTPGDFLKLHEANYGT